MYTFGPWTMLGSGAPTLPRHSWKSMCNFSRPSASMDSKILFSITFKFNLQMWNPGIWRVNCIFVEKKSVCKGTHAVQTCVVKGSAIYVWWPEIGVTKSKIIKLCELKGESLLKYVVVRGNGVPVLCKRDMVLLHGYKWKRRIQNSEIRWC